MDRKPSTLVEIFNTLMRNRVWTLTMRTRLHLKFEIMVEKNWRIFGEMADNEFPYRLCLLYFRKD